MNTQENTKEQISVWKVVNIDKETNEIEVLDYLFRDGKDFHGATGTRFEPVSKKQYKEMTKKSYIAEMLEGCYSLDDLVKHHGTKSYNVLAQRIIDNDEQDSFVFDLSYNEHWDILRECGYNEKDYPLFNCTGGGRMLDANYKGNVSEELNAKIREYESK